MKKKLPGSAAAKAIMREMKILIRIINIASAIASDTKTENGSQSTGMLLYETSLNIKRMLHDVATKRSLHHPIEASFEEAINLLHSKN